MKPIWLSRTATALLLSFPLSLSAQQTGPTAAPVTLAGPPPAQIVNAHTVFLTSAGADPKFPIDSTRAYNDFYALLLSWGHYQLVPSAAQADLVLELHGLAPVTGVYGTDGNVASYTTPAFELRIADAHTQARIWTITSPVALAGRGQTLDRWIALSEGNLLSRLQVLAGQPLSAQQTANLTTMPKSHTARNVVLLGVGAAAFAGLGIALYKHAESNGKAAQDAFCTAHNIPISQCAGG